jgi:hypothetical protein
MGPQTESTPLQPPILEGFDDDPDWFRLHEWRSRLFLVKVQIERFPSTPAARADQQTYCKRNTDAQPPPCLFHDIILLAIGCPIVEASPVYPSC